VEIQLLTGRTHQARVHLAHIGLPIAGDRKYGDREANRRFRERGLRRVFLHAASLRFPHPVTGATVEVAAPLPVELESVLDALDSDSTTR
jgi:23S rRNA pseudouridine955/2504/2580 synthase